MSHQTETCEDRPLRIISDLTFLGLLLAGAFLAATAWLFAHGWKPRGDLVGFEHLAADFASAMESGFGTWPVVAGGLALLVLGGLGFLVGRKHNVVWLSISLAALSIASFPSAHGWLDSAILATCVLGWFVQFLPARAPRDDQGDVGQGTPSTGHH